MKRKPGFFNPFRKRPSDDRSAGEKLLDRAARLRRSDDLPNGVFGKSPAVPPKPPPRVRETDTRITKAEFKKLAARFFEQAMVRLDGSQNTKHPLYRWIAELEVELDEARMRYEGSFEEDE